MSNLFPKISIVTPSYNQAAYLEQTILSIIEQGYPNLEYIIIDGGSSDGSVDVIKKYESHLSYWVSEKDNGLYHAIQKGFDKSTGEIMAWLNSDDMHHRKSLITVAEIFNNYQQIEWLLGKHSLYSDDGKIFQFDTDKYKETWSRWRLLLDRQSFVQQESVFWRRSLWERSGHYINTNYELAADFELWVRFSSHAALYSTNHLLSGFRFRNENQKSQDNTDKYMSEVNVIVNEEKKKKGVNIYLTFCKVVLFLSQLVIVKKWRNKLKIKVMKLQPVLFYTPRQGYIFRKPYNMR